MAFRRPDDGDELRAPGWDADTYVVVRPFISDALEERVSRALVQPLPGMTEADLANLDVSQQLAVYHAQAAFDALLAGMVIRHTLRYEPTPEQVADGEPGDPIPPGRWREDLPPEDWKFIRDAIAARNGSIKRAAEEAVPDGEGGFRDALGAAALPASGDVPPVSEQPS